MPDWSPVRRFGGYAAWGERGRERVHSQQLDDACGCATACGVHGHNHSHAWTGTVPAYDLRSFWGVLGCSCFAF